MAALTTLAKFKEQYTNLPIAAEDGIRHLILACSDMMEKYCQRTFALTTFDELYHGTNDRYLFLKNRPITRVLNVRYGLQPALYVFCSDITTYNATIEVNATSLILTRYANAGIASQDILLYTSFPTVAQMVAKINTLGNGWESSLGGVDPYAGWPTSDLAMFSETHGCRYINAALLVHRWYLSNYRMNAELGELEFGSGAIGVESWAGAWSKGYNNYRINYQAGYEIIPDIVQQICCELVRDCYRSKLYNFQLASESLGAYAYSIAAKHGWEMLTVASKIALQQYKVTDVARWN